MLRRRTRRKPTRRRLTRRRLSRQRNSLCFFSFSDKRADASVSALSILFVPHLIKKVLRPNGTEFVQGLLPFECYSPRVLPIFNLSENPLCPDKTECGFDFEVVRIKPVESRDDLQPQESRIKD